MGVGAEELPCTAESARDRGADMVPLRNSTRTWGWGARGR
jgi:hypothetical protein